MCVSVYINVRIRTYKKEIEKRKKEKKTKEKKKKLNSRGNHLETGRWFVVRKYKTHAHINTEETSNKTV